MNLSLQNAIDLLHTTDAVFALVNGAQTFHCNKRGVAPLLDLFDTQPQLLEGAYVSDKVVGRAAALLMVLGKVQMVYATVISQAAVDCFDHFGVQYCYEQLVPFIQNRNKTGGCPMEQACWNVCDPKEAYTVLKQTLAQMQGKPLVNNLKGDRAMLVSAKEMLQKAREGKYAVGQFNINNLEWTKAILQTAQENNSPVILGVSEGAGKYMCGFKTVVGMVKGMIEELNITVPVAIHLDHGSYEGAMKAIEAGFPSIMFDGSHYPIDENIAKTKELIALCNEKGLSLEAEVGSIGGEEDGVIGAGEVASPDECKMIADLGVTMLAAGIGNIHGKYPENWKGLNFEVLAKVSDATDGMPLVLHGGTGICEEMIKKAISLGVSKINVNTECQLVFAAATRKYVEEGKDLQGKGFDPRKLLAPGFEAIKACVKEKMELFGSVNKA